MRSQSSCTPTPPSRRTRTSRSTAPLVRLSAHLDDLDDDLDDDEEGDEEESEEEEDDEEGWGDPKPDEQWDVGGQSR